jgi:Family of unknown function (DUF5329)
MKATPFRLGTVLIFLLLTANFTSAAAGSPSEKAKIEALIRAVEGLKDARFIRNGTEYDSSSAGKFLRRKWEAQGKEIATARDFIAKAASSSSTSGKPYQIRFKDGKTVNCADFLTTELKRIEGGKGG